MPSDIQELLLVVLWVPSGMLGVEPKTVVCKANTLPAPAPVLRILFGLLQKLSVGTPRSEFRNHF